MRGVFLSVALCLSAISAQAQSTPPHLKPQGDSQQLIVDGKPYLILGGELGNSTASHLGYLEKRWPVIKAAGLNTVLLPIAWEQLEPREGEFDYALLDGILKQARDNDMRVVILWFGAWKNSMSTYVPAWVKHNPQRFSKARSETGEPQDILSPFDPDTLKADRKAFGAMMSHLAKVDKQHTVIMMQVQNEIGMLPSARDHSSQGLAAWQEPVPAALISYLKTNRQRLHPDMRALWERQGAKTKGTWAEVFGTAPMAEEVFQAWGFARFVESEAEYGKSIHKIPHYVNAALNAKGKLPGQYPSAGPLPHLFDVWKAAAPSIDLLAIDLYWPNFVEWSQKFKRYDNPLFVPEANQAGRTATLGDAFYAFGELDAIGFSPFSIENLPSNSRLPQAYELIAHMTPLILEHQGKDTMRGFKAPVDADGKVDLTPQTFRFGGYDFTATFVDPWTPKDQQDHAAHGGLIIQVGPDEFVVAGSGMTLTFADPTKKQRIGIEQIIEYDLTDGALSEGRWLNGDESHQGRHLRLPPDRFGAQKLKLYRYQ